MVVHSGTDTMCPQAGAVCSSADVTSPLSAVQRMRNAVTIRTGQAPAPLVLCLQVISRMADHVPPSEVVRHIIGTYGGQDFGGFRWVLLRHPAHRTLPQGSSALLGAC